VVPGSPGELDDLDAALAWAEEVGYPLLVKASAGGGGRGIRIAHDADELRREFPIAQREAQASAASRSSSSPGEPGTTGTPAAIAVRRASALSPMRRMVCASGPTKT
ncbi:ATP-binding protein, partial [Pseudomonas aeruginosa]